jgi:PadR family transcriptional regulator, regulatory protein PadR
MHDNSFHNFSPGHSGRFGRGPGRRREGRWTGDYSLVDIRLVEPALLAFLQDDNSHGYALLDKLNALGLGAINPSMIYRILRDYEEIGLVQSDWDKSATQGPPRRVYTLTEEGRIALQRAAESLRETANRIKFILEKIGTSQVP